MSRFLKFLGNGPRKTLETGVIDPFGNLIRFVEPLDESLTAAT
jgi:hypothetical protein